MNALHEAFLELVGYDDLYGSHISLDCDRKGEQTVNIAPDWIPAPALAFVLETARRLELSVALTKDGLRIAEHGTATELGVEAVRAVLAADDEDEESA